MKQVLQYSLTVILILSSSFLFGQVSETLKVAHSLTDNLSTLKVKIDEEGSYEVLILSPSGEIQSRPLKKRQYKTGDLINMDINTKYWRSGEYRVLIMDDEGRAVKTKRIVVDLSQKEKQRLRGPQ